MQVVSSHTVNPIMNWMAVIIPLVNGFGIYYKGCAGYSHKIPKSIALPTSQEISIRSPGYPTEKYQKDTVYIWNVTAPETTEEITINILDLDINNTRGILCEDYLKIQDTDDDNFAIFKQCRKPENGIVVARGNKLKITLFTNYDELTGTGFHLTLRVTKSKQTTSQSTTEDSRTTTPVPKTSHTSVRTSTLQLVTNTKGTTPRPTTKRIPPAIQETITLPTSVNTTDQSSPTTKGTLSTTLLATMKATTTPTKSTTVLQTTLTSITTIPTTTSTDVRTDAMKASPTTRALMSSHSTQYSSTELTTNADANQSFLSSQMYETTSVSSSATTDGSRRSTTLDHTVNATQAIQTSKDVSTEMTTFSTETTTPTSTLFEEETLMLILGIAVVEITVLVVGVLALQRRRQRQAHVARRPRDENDRPVSRKTIQSMPNVYEVIEFDDSDEENPYKDLPEGVYDTTFKRRSHLHGQPTHEESRGSYFSRFIRNSKFFGSVKPNENQPMEMKTFKV